MLFCEICKILKNTYFEEHLGTTASESMIYRCCRGRSLSDPSQKVRFSINELESKISTPETEKMKNVKLAEAADASILEEPN